MRRKRCRWCGTAFDYDAKRPNQSYCRKRCQLDMKNEMERIRYGAQHPRNTGVGMDCLLCGRPLRDHGVVEFCSRAVAW